LQFEPQTIRHELVSSSAVKVEKGFATTVDDKRSEIQKLKGSISLLKIKKGRLETCITREQKELEA
jgi:hypothetical protein